MASRRPSPSLPLPPKYISIPLHLPYVFLAARAGLPPEQQQPWGSTTESDFDDDDDLEDDEHVNGAWSAANPRSGGALGRFSDSEQEEDEEGEDGFGMGGLRMEVGDREPAAVAVTESADGSLVVAVVSLVGLVL